MPYLIRKYLYLIVFIVFYIDISFTVSIILLIYNIYYINIYIHMCMYNSRVYI